MHRSLQRFLKLAPVTLMRGQGVAEGSSMTGTGAHVNDIDPVLFSARMIEGYVLRRYQAVKSTDGVLSLVVLVSMASCKSRFDYARKVLELDYLGFYKLHIGWESKKNGETNRREMGLVKRFIYQG